MAWNEAKKEWMSQLRKRGRTVFTGNVVKDCMSGYTKYVGRKDQEGASWHRLGT